MNAASPSPSATAPASSTPPASSTREAPNSGLFLQLTADHNPDLAIPGTNYTFGMVADAQAAGDLEALLSANRRAARVALGPNPAAAILRMANPWTSSRTLPPRRLRKLNAGGYEGRSLRSFSRSAALSRNTRPLSGVGSFTSP